MKKSFLLVILALFSESYLTAQNLHYELPDNANKMFAVKNYLKAKELYRDLYKNNLKNIKYKYRLGVSLLYTYEWKNGIEILEQAAKKVDCPQEVWFHLARGYHLTNRYDLAIKYYKKYTLINGAKADLVTQCKRNIQTCLNAKELVKHPLNVSFENLGKRINSKGKEYLPEITPAEDFILFTTRREGTTGRIYDIAGYYTADIYLSKYKYGKWSKARSLGYPNSYGNEQTAGISENGKFAFFYVNNPKSKNNLQVSEKKKTSFRKATEIKEKFINDKGNKQIAATVSKDNQTLIFASDRANGYGATDLYICKKLPNKKWGLPTNMGQTINTKYDDCYPYLTDNGNTLYFASKGHKTMGGYDIFKTTYNKKTKTWSIPKNIGYPINTPDDNLSICFNSTKKYAYVAAYRKDSYGDLDIYRVNFESKDPPYSTIKGFVVDKDSAIIKTPLHIDVFSKTSGDLKGSYETNTQKGSYLMILPPDVYEIIIDDPNKGTFKKRLVVRGRKYFRKEITANIQVIFNNDTPK